MFQRHKIYKAILLYLKLTYLKYARFPKLCVCMCVCAYYVHVSTCATTYMWRLDDNVKFVLSFPLYTGSQDQTQITILM